MNNPASVPPTKTEPVATAPSAPAASPLAPRLPPALRIAKPAPQPSISSGSLPKLSPDEKQRSPGSELSSKTAVAPAAMPAQDSAPSPTTVQNTPPQTSTVRPPTGGTITPTQPPPKKITAPNQKLFVPPPRSTTKLIPTLDRLALIEGTFLPEGADPFTVEVPLTGNPVVDRQSLVNLARKKFPAGAMKMTTQRIYTRDRETPPGYAPGMNLGQLFGDAGSDTEVAIEIGHVFYDGFRCQIFLRNLRSRDAVTIMLRPPAGGQMVFSNQIARNRPVSELGLIVKEILGQGARELTITMQEAK